MFDTKTTGDKEGVSPVIGVILMVAITVILAAVIGTFVLDLAGNLEQNAQVSVTFDEDATEQTVDVQINSVQRADYVELRDDGGNEWDSTSAGYGTDNVGQLDYASGSTGDEVAGVIDFEAAAGSTATLNYNATGAASGTITAVGFLDGEGSVLQRYDYGDA